MKIYDRMMAVAVSAGPWSLLGLAAMGIARQARKLDAIQ